MWFKALPSSMVQWGRAFIYLCVKEQLTKKKRWRFLVHLCIIKRKCRVSLANLVLALSIRPGRHIYIYI